MIEQKIPTRMFCQICGHLHKIDFWVPDEIWNEAIHPRWRDSHVCINCFMERADERLLEWDKEIKMWPCSMATQIEIQKIELSEQDYGVQAGRLMEAMNDPKWISHNIGDVYSMDGQSGWKIAYYPIFEDGKTGKFYNEPRALVEKPIKNGTDFREVPLRYLTKLT